MVDPLSVTTGIITLYSAVWQLKSLKDSYTDAPEIIRSLERDCDETLTVILHTKYRLDSYDRQLTPDDTFNPVDIREKLRNYIATLHPEAKALETELTALLRSPETNYAYLKSLVVKAHHVRHLENMHKKIVDRLVQFDRLLRSVDGENTDWIRKNSGRNSTPPSRTLSRRRRDSMLSFLSTGSGESDDATLCATKSVVSEEGTEILLHAITGGRQKDVKMILRMLAVDPNLKDAETGRYPLHVATVCGDLVMMEELLKCRAAPDARDKHGQTALHIAARKDMESAVELLLRKKADPNAEDNEGRTPLWHAAWHGDSPKTFQVLIRPNAQGTDIINHHCRDPDMPTALWAAAASPCLETAQALLKAGARTEVLDHQGSTVLHKAAWPIATAIAPLLLDRGAEVSVQDKEGKLPLHRAAAVGKTSIVEALLERMDDGGVNETDRQGATALILGAQRGSLPLVRCLTEKWKAKCSVQDQWGNGAFYYACANGHILVATYLLGLGADINEGNKEGDTPLYVAAKWGHSEMVRLLLQLGADRSARSSQEASGVKGRATPAEVARKAGHEGVARMIETFELEDEPVTWRVEIIEPRRTGS